MVTLLRKFKENSMMKVNPKKIQFMILGKTPRQPIMISINQIKDESQKVVLLGLTIDDRLTFQDHADMLCSTANYKLHALRTIRKYLTVEKNKAAIQRIYKEPIELCVCDLDVLS